MEMSGPEPGTTLNDGPPVEPRPASSVIVLRGGDAGLEILLVRRNPEARFMGGAWVFPGGAVDRAERDAVDAHILTGVRETEEEAGITLDPTTLVPFSRWITPPQVSIRFDTWFFLAPVAHGIEPQVDGAEVVDARWIAPSEALAAHEGGNLFMVFPTIKHLEQLAPFATADELVAHARAQEVRPVEPRVVITGETARVYLPGEPGYDDAPDHEAS